MPCFLVARVAVVNVEKPVQDGRSVEIQRLIGRSLRAAVDLEKLGEVSIVIDCDVIQADGGTRTTGISGGYVAYDALRQLAEKQGVSGPSITSMVSRRRECWDCQG